ncbi:MAG: hypothetical protein J7578_18075 [Chitinophagaceae bacterium]|nr:hypothetical protein [Chitinophagaceae bacterium]
MHVISIVGIISSWSTLVIPALLLVLRPQRMAKANWALLAFCLLQFIMDRLHEFADLRGIEHPLNFIFVVLEYCSLAALMYLSLQKKRNRRWLFAGSMLFFVLSGLTWLRLGADHYSSIRGISAILLISYAMFFFMEWITAETFAPINARAEFWMVTGTLLYLAGNFFFFITMRHHFTEGLLIHYLVNMLRNGCFVAAMLQSWSLVRTRLMSANKY